MTPDSGVAGEWGTWTLNYRIGAGGIRRGGGVRVQLPDYWHAGIRNSGFRMQASDPRDGLYVSARCSRPEVRPRTVVEQEPATSLVKGDRRSNLNRWTGYFTFVTRVVVEDGDLREGDTLTLIYGDRSGGSPGFRLGITAGPPRALIFALDTEGRNTFRLHSRTPVLRTEAAPAVEMLVTARSEGVVGEAVPLHIAAVDEFGNPATRLAGEIGLRVAQGQAGIAGSARFEAGRGWAEASFTPTQPGIVRIEAAEASRALRGVSNPIVVTATAPAERLYWGDLHSHTRYSVQDAVGEADSAHGYARRISGLDFYAMTDHSVAPTELMRGLTAREWPQYTATAERHYAPEEFVTLHAYEASFGSPYGHHNVYFRGQPGRLIAGSATLPDLWKALRAGEALTIPHHTMKMPAVIDWSRADDAALRRNFEIYSAHGLSEANDPSHPLAFEQSLFTNASETSKTGMSAQGAWERGLMLSTIAASDDHRAHPGQPHYGLAAVRARSLTREAIFDALHARRTYGTTGARIVLDFRAGGAAMGSQKESGGEVPIEFTAMGTDIVDEAEVLRHVRGRPGWEVVHRERPAREQVRIRFTDRAPKGSVIYYARLRQRALVRERIAMAWSSPVWLTVR